MHESKVTIQEGLTMLQKKKVRYEGNILVQPEKFTYLSLAIEDLKGMSGKIEIPLNNDVYGLVGNNGSGKSTIMTTLSKLVPPYQFRLSNNDCSDKSKVSYTVYDKTDSWELKRGKTTKTSGSNQIRFFGRYEGSLFYGTRFEDSRIVDELMQNGKITQELLVDADKYIVETLGHILHNDKESYRNLKHLRNRKIALEMGIKNLPYFYEINGKVISQYRMSSGECLLISLLHFLHNSVVRKSIPQNQHTLLLIDEVELALHPVAVRRLIEILKSLTKQSSNLTCIVSSHSIEVIRSISPDNLFNLVIKTTVAPDSTHRYFKADNPIYPCYLMKDIYVHNGYDFVILVEDDLAKKVVESSLTKLQLRQNKLINIVPVGGWANVFELHKTFRTDGTLGLNTNILSIIDGDVQATAEKKFKNLNHMFLPIASIEKFLRQHLLGDETSEVKKDIKDTLFTGVKSLEDFLQEYSDEEGTKKKSDETYEGDNNGKRLYKKLKNYCETERKISEDMLIDTIFQIVGRNICLDSFEKNLKIKLN